MSSLLVVLLRLWTTVGIQNASAVTSANKYWQILDLSRMLGGRSSSFCYCSWIKWNERWDLAVMALKTFQLRRSKWSGFYEKKVWGCITKLKMDILEYAHKILTIYLPQHQITCQHQVLSVPGDISGLVGYILIRETTFRCRSIVFFLNQFLFFQHGFPIWVQFSTLFINKCFQFIGSLPFFTSCDHRDVLQVDYMAIDFISLIWHTELFL